MVCWVGVVDLYCVLIFSIGKVCVRYGVFQLVVGFQKFEVQLGGGVFFGFGEVFLDVFVQESVGLLCFEKVFEVGVVGQVEVGVFCWLLVVLVLFVGIDDDLEGFYYVSKIKFLLEWEFEKKLFYVSVLMMVLVNFCVLVVLLRLWVCGFLVSILLMVLLRWWVVLWLLRWLSMMMVVRMVVVGLEMF